MALIAHWVRSYKKGGREGDWFDRKVFHDMEMNALVIF